MTAAQQEETPRQYDCYRDNDVQRIAIPLDAETRHMLDKLVAHLYAGRIGAQRHKYRGKVVEMAIRSLYQRTKARHLPEEPAESHHSLDQLMDRGICKVV